MNLTDNEIIKALECCVKSTSGNDCEKLHCPACKEFGCYYMDISDRDDSYEALVEGMGKDALDLIKRKDKVNKLSAKEIVDLKMKVEQQRAEIERLTNKLEQREEMMANLGVELTAMCSAANSYKLQYEKTQVVVERLENSLAIAKKELKRYTKSKQEVVNNVIKKFWKKIKKYCKREICFFTPDDEREFIKWGDNLVKEMVGE